MYFSGSKNVELHVVEGGYHFLSITNSNEVSEKILEFIDAAIKLL
jgi:hypothetical protein